MIFVRTQIITMLGTRISRNLWLNENTQLSKEYERNKIVLKESDKCN